MKHVSSRVEFIAIPVVLVVLGVLVALMIAAEVGVWTWIVVTTALVLLGLVMIGILISRRRHPPASDAPRTTPTTGGAYRVLVVADAGLPAQAVREKIVPHARGGPVEAVVVAPALRSRLAHWTGDDSERNRAETHLAETLDAFEEGGIPATGAIGSDDPIQAADDALRTFAADEVVFVTGSETNWLEHDVLVLARERYAVPITMSERRRERANDGCHAQWAPPGSQAAAIVNAWAAVLHAV